MNRTQPKNNMETTIERIKTCFPSVYLTLISVIQAGVLGYFIFLLDQKTWSDYVARIVPLLITFIVIVTTWNEYMMGSTAFRWIPSLKDSFIPFSLGISELVVIRNVFSPASLWFYSLAGFCLVGCIAFFNMFYSAGRYPENANVFAVLGRIPLLTEIWTLCGVGMFFCLGLLLGQCSSTIFVYIMSMVVCLVFFSGFLLRGVVYWRRITSIPTDNSALPADTAEPDC